MGLYGGNLLWLIILLLLPLFFGGSTELKPGLKPGVKPGIKY
ncbi:hypothetical protein BX659_10244 [Orenia metallireducens]|jgi:hypothetical protein|uniref:Uncharacterized protein n=1 Tax=Orenia metallireducens TaxID=1413210 RepID=A0A285F243_9FIRM|nr:hypothetical protein [Orenia metallireducens]PRX34729.1 hypothetical protein BX659_10244 [Orenia metallireducens]SNY05380.1 hypothetical protein SAMN06265827_10144 [Orenia metallireducens]